MKFIKKYGTHTEYNAYITSSAKVLPNVSYCENENEVHYKPWYDPERFVAKFNITNTTSSTPLFNNPTLLSKIEIDGVEYTGNDVYSHYNHTFSTTGIHIVKYTLNDGVTSIGSDSFASRKNMVSITIPDTITTIGQSAFASCTGLTSVTIPNSVTTIGVAAFADCSLASITLPSSVTSINSSLGNLDFEDVIFESINPNATFVRDTTNKVLTNITGDTLICGFNNTVAIPNSVTSIGDGAFTYCKGLTSVTIPDSVTSIGHNAFYDCSGLTSIIVDGSNTIYDSRNNCNAIIETATNTLLIGCKNTVIPNSVTTIDSLAFYHCNGLISITIPDSVTSIGQQAFYLCTGLTSVTIGNGVTTIGSMAFQLCTGLTSIVVNSGNSVYDSRNNCNAIIETATNTLIYGCQNTIIPNTVTSIGNNAFYNFTGITSITIPNGVTSIGGSAFSLCTGLTSVTIGNSVTTIGSNAFYDCSGLTNIISLATTAPTIYAYTFQNVKTGGTLTVPSGSTGYDTWMGTGNYYLGKYNWTKVEQ